MPDIELVIFDCDGVLVDSEPISVEVLVEAVQARGGALDAATIYSRFLGRSMATVTESLEAEFGVAVDDRFLNAMRERLYERFRSDLAPIAGVGDAIRSLGAPCCVASSSQPERIRLSLEITGLAPLFGERLFSATMVREGKPAPDLFLHAAASFDARPERCIVIEDSPAGLEAARRAGMRALAFTGGGHAEAAGLRDAVQALTPLAIFDDMRALPRLIAAQGAPGTTA